MATLENCQTCYKVSAPECADSYIISGLTPLTEIVAIATDRFGRTVRVDDGNPVNADGELTIVFPDGMNAFHSRKLTIRLYALEDYENNRLLCDPIDLTICDVTYQCIELSFHRHSETITDVTLICYCNGEPACELTCSTVASEDELPDPLVCDFALVRDVSYDDIDISIRRYSSGTWNTLASVVATWVVGGLNSFTVSLTSGWSVNINGNIVTSSGELILDSAVETAQITFIEGSCSYIVSEAERPAATYCLYEFAAESGLLGWGTDNGQIYDDAFQQITNTAPPNQYQTIINELQAAYPNILFGSSGTGSSGDGESGTGYWWCLMPQGQTPPVWYFKGNNMTNFTLIDWQQFTCSTVETNCYYLTIPNYTDELLEFIYLQYNGPDGSVLGIGATSPNSNIDASTWPTFIVELLQSICGSTAAISTTIVGDNLNIQILDTYVNLSFANFNRNGAPETYTFNTLDCDNPDRCLYEFLGEGNVGYAFTNGVIETAGGVDITTPTGDFANMINELKTLNPNLNFGGAGAGELVEGVSGEGYFWIITDTLPSWYFNAGELTNPTQINFTLSTCGTFQTKCWQVTITDYADPLLSLLGVDYSPIGGLYSTAGSPTILKNPYTTVLENILTGLCGAGSAVVQTINGNDLTITVLSSYVTLSALRMERDGVPEQYIWAEIQCP